MAPVEEMRFEEGTLLVIEVKTTLGKSKTPGFLKTQQNGGSINIKRIQHLIHNKAQDWNPSHLTNIDPTLTSKLAAIDNALEEKKSNTYMRKYSLTAKAP
ncbi:hypothetical protein [Pseudomonas sp. I2]|uniref:hypothetical protein n=1 Tax=Pseudomonas sp. I2 TaxID=1338438 RepID=UPI0034D797E2